MGTWEPLLDELMRERAPRLLAYAAMVAGSDAEAPDVLQDALVKSFSKRRPFTHINAAEAYVRRAIPSIVIDRARRKRLPLAPLDDALTSATPLADPDHAMDVRGALAVLSPQQRACVALRYYDDLTVPEVARQLGIAEGTVKRHLHDATSRLALALGDDVAPQRESRRVAVHGRPDREGV